MKVKTTQGENNKAPLRIWDLSLNAEPCLQTLLLFYLFLSPTYYKELHSPQAYNTQDLLTHPEVT